MRLSLQIFFVGRIFCIARFPECLTVTVTVCDLQASAGKAPCYYGKVTLDFSCANSDTYKSNGSR